MLFTEVMGSEKALLSGGSLCQLFICLEERNSSCICMLLCGPRRHSAVESPMGLTVRQALWSKRSQDSALKPALLQASRGCLSLLGQRLQYTPDAQQLLLFVIFLTAAYLPLSSWSLLSPLPSFLLGTPGPTPAQGQRELFSEKTSVG